MLPLVGSPLYFIIAPQLLVLPFLSPPLNIPIHILIQFNSIPIACQLLDE